jgi:hypothetical protein
VDHQPLPYDQIALDPPGYFGILGSRLSFKDPTLADDHVLTALQITFDRPVQDKPST